MKTIIAICIVAAAIVGAQAIPSRWEPIRVPEYSLHFDDVGIATDVSVTLTNSRIYGLSKARFSNFTRDAAGKLDGFTANVARLYIEGQHVTSGKTTLSSNGIFSGAGRYTIQLKNLQFQQTLGTGDRSISVEAVATWFDGYGNKQITKTVNDYLSANAPAAIEANQQFVIAEIEKVVKSLIG